jgi:hypothetical protein
MWDHLSKLWKWEKWKAKAVENSDFLSITGTVIHMSLCIVLTSRSIFSAASTLNLRAENKQRLSISKLM